MPSEPETPTRIVATRAHAAINLNEDFWRVGVIDNFSLAMRDHQKRQKQSSTDFADFRRLAKGDAGRRLEKNCGNPENLWKKLPSVEWKLMDCKLWRRLLDGFVGRASQAEADGAVQLDGGQVAGGDFEVDPRNSRRAEAGQRPQDESPTQSPSAVLGRDADILDRPPLPGLHDSLDCPAVFLLIRREVTGNQPRRPRHKRRPLHNLAHQRTAAGRVTQAGKNFRVDLGSKALEFGEGMAFQ